MEKNNTQIIALNLIPFLAESFSTNKKIYKDIDKLYNTDKSKFNQFVKGNEFYNHQISREGGLEQEYYFKKSLGLFLAGKESIEITKSLIDISIKGWKYTYAYLQNQSIINMTKFMNNFTRKNRGLDNLTDDEINSNFVILMFLATQLEIKIDESDTYFKGLVTALYQRLIHYEKDKRFGINYLSKNDLQQLRKLEMKVINETNIKFKPCEYQADAIKKSDGIQIHVNNISKIERYFIAFDYIFDLEEVSLPTVIGDNIFNSKDIQELIFCYTQFLHIDKDSNKEEIDFDELVKFLYPAIQIRYLAQEYKRTKQFFFKNFNEGLYEEIEQKDNIIKQLSNDNSLLKADNNSLIKENELLQRELKRLQSELKQTQQEKSELQGLREFIFNADAKVEYKENYSIDYDRLNSIKGIVIGGTPTWQNKLKEILSNWKYINIDTINFDERIIVNTDTVFIYVNYLSHALYYKVMSVINRNEKEIVYLKDNQNIDIVLRQINDNTLL